MQGAGPAQFAGVFAVEAGLRLGELLPQAEGALTHALRLGGVHAEALLQGDDAEAQGRELRALRHATPRSLNQRCCLVAQRYVQAREETPCSCLDCSRSRVPR